MYYLLGPETWDTLELYWDLYLLTLLLGLLGLVMVLRRPRQMHHNVSRKTILPENINFYAPWLNHNFEQSIAELSQVFSPN